MTKHWRRRIKVLLGLSLSGLLLPFITLWIGQFQGLLPWLVDLACHWQWLFAGVTTACALTLSVTERRWLLSLPMILLPWASASSPLPYGPPITPVFAIASANVHAANSDSTALARWLTQEHPDVVVLLEVSPAFAQTLGKLDAYPFRTIEPANSPFGIAVLSRYPFHTTNTVFDEDRIPHIETSIIWQQKRIGIIAFHPMPPLSGYFREIRDQRLLELTQRSHLNGTPTLIAGDMNATPWSSALKSVERKGWHRATTLQPTWPAAGLGLMGIPIDHVLASPEWQRANSAVGPAIGSDHLPIIAKLVLTPD